MTREAFQAAVARLVTAGIGHVTISDHAAPPYRYCQLEARLDSADELQATLTRLAPLVVEVRGYLTANVYAHGGAMVTISVSRGLTESEKARLPGPRDLAIEMTFVD